VGSGIRGSLLKIPSTVSRLALIFPAYHRLGDQSSNTSVLELPAYPFNLDANSDLDYTSMFVEEEDG